MIINGEKMENKKTKTELNNIQDSMFSEMAKASVKELKKSLDLSELEAAQVDHNANQSAEKEVII